jgi:hypothetical protein
VENLKKELQEFSFNPNKKAGPSLTLLRSLTTEY